MLKLNSLCKTIFLIFLANSLCFPCLEKWTSKFPVFPVFPVPWPPWNNVSPYYDLIWRVLTRFGSLIGTCCIWELLKQQLATWLCFNCITYTSPDWRSSGDNYRPNYRANRSYLHSYQGALVNTAVLHTGNTEYKHWTFFLESACNE